MIFLRSWSYILSTTNIYFLYDHPMELYSWERAHDFYPGRWFIKTNKIPMALCVPRQTKTPAPQTQNHKEKRFFKK